MRQFVGLSALLLFYNLIAAPFWGSASAREFDSQRLNETIQAAEFQGEVMIAITQQSAPIYHWKSKPDSEARPDTPAVPWRWASVTKQMMAILVMQQVERGALHLDQPAGRYLPEFTSPNAQTVTLRQLLQHQSGLPNPNDPSAIKGHRWAFYGEGFAEQRNPVNGFCAGPAVKQPGGTPSYNNCDYMVLGAVLEAVTGQSWHALFERDIAKPLGLSTTGAFLKPTYPGDPGTRIGTIRGRREWHWDLSTLGAAASMFGSAEDLLAIDQALLEGKLLSEESLEQMWDGNPVFGYQALGQWAYPAQLKGCDGPIEIVERHGDMGATVVRNLLLPDDGIALVMFTDKRPFDFGFVEQEKGFSYEMLSAILCTDGTTGE